MAYCDYEFYKNGYGGNMPPNLFKKYSILATAKIRQATSNRINEENIKEEVKICTCALAEELKKTEKHLDVKSETIGKWSRTYTDKKEQKNRIYSIIKEHLEDITDEYGTPLLYRGCF